MRRVVAHPPDVLLTDLGMPRLDGWGLIAEIRARPGLSATADGRMLRLTALAGAAPPAPAAGRSTGRGSSRPRGSPAAARWSR